MKLKDKLYTIGWNVAYKKKNDKKFTVIKNNYNSWTADPFIFEYHGDVYIFGELYNYDRWQGCLGYTKLVNGKFSKWHEIIIEDYHLSFPNICIENDDIYIYPESEQNNSFYRYKAVNFPDEWQKEKVYVNNRKLVDSVFFNIKDKKYFMSYDISKEPKQLFICPVKKDNIEIEKRIVINEDDSEARLGGNILIYNHELIRVAQDCKDFYGKSLKFFKMKFDGKNYSEELLKEIDVSDVDLNSKNKFHGIHTYNCSENYEVIDLKFKKIIFYGIFGKAKKMIRKLLRR